MMAVPRTQTCLPISFTSHNRDNTHSLFMSKHKFTRTQIRSHKIQSKKKNTIKKQHLQYPTTVLAKEVKRKEKYYLHNNSNSVQESTKRSKANEHEINKYFQKEKERGRLDGLIKVWVWVLKCSLVTIIVDLDLGPRTQDSGLAQRVRNQNSPLESVERKKS